MASLLFAMDPQPSPVPAGRPVAVVDIDGVLADVRHRLYHLRKRPKDWDAFFAAAPADPVLEEGLAVAHQLSEQHDLVYLSGRPERCRPETLRWLAEAGLPPGELLMRRDGDRRPARQVKVQVLRGLARERTVAILVDDDPAVCAAARAAGFHVFPATWMPTADVADHAALHTAQEGDGRT